MSRRRRLLSQPSAPPSSAPPPLELVSPADEAAPIGRQNLQRTLFTPEDDDAPAPPDALRPLPEPAGTDRQNLADTLVEAVIEPPQVEPPQVEPPRAEPAPPPPVDSSPPAPRHELPAEFPEPAQDAEWFVGTGQPLPPRAEAPVGERPVDLRPWLFAFGGVMFFGVIAVIVLVWSIATM